MKVAYFDCFSGASGDMILGALINAGGNLESLAQSLRCVPIKGYSLKKRRKTVHGIAATSMQIKVEKKHTHLHRTFHDIKTLIEKSSLPDQVRSRSIEAFEKIARAEAKIHRKTIRTIHFHEVGAIDAVIDVVGAMLLVEQLGIDKIYCSKMTLGTGEIECMHGILPVPAPATVEILKGVPVKRTNIEAELTTPTGAAILTTLTSRFDYFPSLTISRTGYGTGTRELKERPNVLRVIIGDTETNTTDDVEKESIAVISCEIDDMNPEVYGYVSEKLFALGCVDVHLIPIQMKKGRPGVILEALAKKGIVRNVVNFILKETSTFGVKVNELERFCLPRKVVVVQTPFGKIKAKAGMMGGKVIKVIPEYESVKEAAISTGTPFIAVYFKTIKEIEKRFFG